MNNPIPGTSIVEDGEYEGREMFQQPERQNNSFAVSPLSHLCFSMEKLSPTYLGMCDLGRQYNYSKITQFCMYNVEDKIRKTVYFYCREFLKILGDV